jgi:predicted hotdog family 3-hydroxylacyl-ACP dehydratase
MTDPSSFDIETLIPHRCPMRIVERVCEATDATIETVSTVRDTWPTVRNGNARTVMLIELVAQTAAALAGWVERDKETGRGLGYLVGVPHAELRRPFVPVGTVLHCYARVTQAIDNYRAFEGRVTDQDGEELVTVSIQALRPDEEA